MIKLSVVIPTCDRPETLHRCLELLQPFPTEGCEIIITDDSRDDATRAVVEKDFPNVHWVRGPQRGPAANRNSGALAGQGTWLAFLDDDCQPAPSWLPTLLHEIERDGVDVIEGKTVCPNKRDSLFQEQVENLHGDLFWSCNLAIRREAFEKLGGFDEDFTEAGGEDLELAWRIRGAGLAGRFSAETLIFHPPRQLTWRRLWWRTLFIRWHLLYRIKTQQAPALNASAARSCSVLVGQQFIDLLRSTFHFFSRFDKRRWRTALASQLWRWFTFPIVLPYLVYWDLHFRRQLKQSLLNPNSSSSSSSLAAP
jgi:GT2 family glycosyltransferase